MKKILLPLFLLLCPAAFLKAQFTGNPASPLSLCSATGTQANVHAFSDNKGGYYTFWIDNRAGSSVADIYGQHFTSAGNRVWEADGRLIIHPNGKNIIDFKCVPWQTGMLIAWIQETGSAPDSLLTQYLDTAGHTLWPKPALVANTGSGIIYLETDGFNIFPNSFGATIAYAVTISGGADDFSFNRIDFSGKLRWANNHFLFVHGPYYNYRSCSDGLGGVYGLYKGNGLGSPMAIEHYDTSGAELFSSPLVFTTGAGGVSNSGQIDFNLDASNNLYITWDDNQNKVYITKIKPNGTFAWTPAYLDVSNYNSSQSYSYSLLNGGKIYTIWDDNRPGAGNTSFYIQKTDTSGVNDWTPGGVMLGSMNSYIPYPKIAFSDSGIVVAMFETNSGLYGQRVRADSTVEFPVNGQLLANPSKDAFYADYMMVDDGNGCTASFWSTTNGDLYAAQLCSPSFTTAIKNNDKNESVRLFPNPSSSLVNWAIPLQVSRNVLVNITDLSGRMVYSKYTPASSGTIDVSAFSKGMYFVQMVSGKSVYSRKLVVE